MTERVKPDGFLPRSMVGYRDSSDAFLRSTILRVIDEEIQEWEEMRHGYVYQHEVEARRRCVVAIESLRDLRARFEEADDE